MTYLFGMTAPPQNQQHNFDLRSGYVLLLLLLLTLAALTWFGIRLLNNPQDLRIIAFEQIGNLRIDDPVKLRGVDIGTVKRIELLREKVLVFIETQKPLIIHQGYRIDDRDVGLMGDRILMIYDGNSTAPVLLRTDTLAGSFHNGVSETVGFAWKLRDIVDSFTIISSQLLHGTQKRKSIINQVNTMADITDSASGSIMNFTAQFNKNFNAKIDSIEQFVSIITKFSKSAAASTPEYVSSLDSRIKNLVAGVDKLDAMSDMLLKYAERVEKTGGPEGSAGESQIKGKINTLHDAINHLKEGLLKFQIYLK